MSDTQATGTTRETAIGNQRTFLAKMHALNIRGGIQHLLHTRTTLWSLVSNHYAIATFYFTSKNSFAGILLRIEHNSRTFEVPKSFIYTCSLYYAAILGDISKENSETAVLCIGVLKVADTAIGTISIECAPLLRLRAHLSRESVARCSLIDAISLSIHITVNNTVFLHSLTKRHAIHTWSRAIDKTTFI